jgi:hypothetical protein
MAQATRNSTGFATRLSSIFSDPALRAIFERAERDDGTARVLELA